MSIFYILGSEKQVSSNVFQLKHFDIDGLRISQDNIDLLKDKYYYIFLFVCYFGYDIRNIQYFNNDTNKKRFEQFIDFIKTNLQNNRISFYQFWNANKLDIEENVLYYTKELSTNINDYPEDLFQFQFNTKYIFVDNKILN